jgi:hypothetical protein
MTLVYSLREKLKSDPKYVAQVQAVTLGHYKPNLPGGLKGVYGLFGSDQWWKNIADGLAPVTRLKGTITGVHFEGMQNEGRRFEMRMPDGSTYQYSCVANQKLDRKRYVTGKAIEFVYLTEPLKNPVPVTNGSFQTHTDEVLEIWIED